jgi:hypothetical protein
VRVRLTRLKDVTLLASELIVFLRDCVVWSRTTIAVCGAGARGSVGMWTVGIVSTVACVFA